MISRIEAMEKQIELLTFQLERLYENSALDRYVFESRLTKEQFGLIMDLLDEKRREIDAGKKVRSSPFEEEVYEIVPEKRGQYHFCETITRLFAEEGRWEEVFPALYGELPKYRK